MLLRCHKRFSKASRLHGRLTAAASAWWVLEWILILINFVDWNDHMVESYNQVMLWRHRPQVEAVVEEWGPSSKADNTQQQGQACHRATLAPLTKPRGLLQYDEGASTPHSLPCMSVGSALRNLADPSMEDIDQLLLQLLTGMPSIEGLGGGGSAPGTYVAFILPDSIRKRRSSSSSAAAVVVGQHRHMCLWAQHGDDAATTGQQVAQAVQHTLAPAMAAMLFHQPGKMVRLVHSVALCCCSCCFEQHQTTCLMFCAYCNICVSTLCTCYLLDPSILLQNHRRFGWLLSAVAYM
jgi:hypothetical protein